MVDTEPTESASVALVNMPYSMLVNPSLALGLLKSALRRRGIGAQIFHLSIDLAERIGSQVYDQIAMGPPTALWGEWSFSAAVFGDDEQADAAYFEQIVMADARDAEATAACALLPSVRAEIEPFLERCLNAMDWSRFRVVGFTSVFQQHLASLALAKRLKERHPELFIVLGGPNCEAQMGEATFRCFPWIDALCSGEADHSFPELVERLLAGRGIGEIPGVLVRPAHHRGPAEGQATPIRKGRLLLAKAAPPAAAPVQDMDALPYPDFDDYFRDMARATLSGVEPRLLFETSRGCWWGKKHHCTFCGLNGSTLAFRHKSAGRALDELTWLVERYGKRQVAAVDNIIPMQYFNDLLPALKERPLGVELFYETKANLRRDQVELYRDAGVRHVQPGIESLSSPVLALMRKGVKRLQNVQTLKWCRQYGVSAAWNFIVGFPGEDPQDYAGLEDLVASLTHLEPPDGWGEVRVDRFSPYFFDSEAFGLRNVRPNPSYRHVYRTLAPEDLRDLAYYFECDFDGKERVRGYTAELVAALRSWKEQHSRSGLFSMALGSRLLVFDLRPIAETFTIVLDGVVRRVYEACDSVTSPRNIARQLAGSGAPVDAASIDRAIEFLLARRLLVRDDDDVLGVVVPLGYDYAPADEVHVRILDEMSRLGAPPAARSGVEPATGRDTTPGARVELQPQG